MNGERTRGWPTTAAVLREELSAIGLGDEQGGFLESRARPAVMVASHPAEESAFPLGATRFGGRPDLPAGATWPTRPAYADGADMAEWMRASAEGAMIAAGLAPPWLEVAEAKRRIAAHRRELDAMDREMRREIDVLRRKLERMEAKGPGREEEKEMLRRYISDYGNGFDDGLSFAPSPEDAERDGERASRMEAVLTGPFPLSFLAQLDLADLCVSPGFDPAFPAAGRLLFFYDLLALPPSYDPASRIGFRVVFDVSGRETLHRLETPPELSDPCIAEARLRVAGPVLAPAITTMPAETAAREGLKLRGKAKEGYEEWLTDHVGWPVDAAASHQFGGWPRSIQSHMQEKAQLTANGVNTGESSSWKGKKAKALLAGAPAWRLLFQFSADEPIGNPLPGAISFLIREDDLADRHFDRCWAIYEES